ncbi:hypothetical protein JYU23_00095 [bacterium AH-315-C07]|nr:hypothetical protein [bacterium AH-315-C07]
MKTLNNLGTIILLVFFTSHLLLAQDNIYFKNGRVVKDVKIHTETEDKIEYEKNGSLHDALKADIKKIETQYAPILIDKPVDLFAVDKEPQSNYDSHGLSNDESDFNSTVIVHFSPMGLIEPEPVIKADLEVVLNKRISFQQEIGQFLANGRWIDRDNQSVSGFITKSEIKIFLDDINDSGIPGYGLYISGQAFYKFHQLTSTFTYNKYDNVTGNSKEVYSEANTEKVVYGFHGKIGFQKIFKNGFVLDSYAGAGLRFKNEKYTSTYDEPEYDDSYNIRSIEPGITAGVKIGYSF